MKKYQTVWVDKKTKLLVRYLAAPTASYKGRTMAQAASDAVEEFAIEVYRSSPYWNKRKESYILSGPTRKKSIKKGRGKSSRRSKTVNLSKRALEVAKRVAQVTPWTLPKIVEDSVAHYFISALVGRGESVETAELIYRSMQA